MAASDASSDLRRDLRAMTLDAITFSVMVGVGETYVPAFALAAGLSDVTAALVATLPMLGGALFQLVSPAAVRRLDSHKRWVVLCALVQAASFLPLCAAAAGGRIGPPLLYACAAVYWGFGMATGPAWNTWVGTIVPARLRSRVFARRARWSQAAIFSGLLTGGLVLEQGSASGRPLLAFAGLFAAAAAARALSASFLARTREPRPIPLGGALVSPRSFLASLRDPGHGRLLGFLIAFQFAVHVVAPFITPYMLGPLGLSYAEITALTGAAFLARIAALPALDRAARRLGVRRLLVAGALGIVPLPALWLVSDSFLYLLALQLCAGTVWAAFELAVLLAFFERIPAERRTQVLSMFNLANALAIVGGSAVGSLLTRMSPGGIASYVVLFAASSGLRALCLLALRRVPELPGAEGAMPVRTLAVRPSAGAVQRPIVAGLDAEPSPGDGAPR
jgi:MFS family permease